MKYILLAVVLLAVAGCSAGAVDEADPSATQNTSSSKKSEEVAEQLKVKMTIQGESYSISLNNSQAAKDFYALLPLTLELEDYNNTEKVAGLPQKLDTSDSPAGTAAEKGDLSYYAPWGNLAIFYQDFGYGSGLVKLGKIDQGSEMLTKFGDSFEVLFETAN